MKKLFLIVFVGLFFISCMSTYTLKKEDKIFVYSHKVELSRKILSEKLIDYINNNFQSPQDVITTIQDGYIASRGKIQVVNSPLAFPLPVYCYMDFSAAFKFEDGSYKTKFGIVKIYQLHHTGWREDIKSPISKAEIKAIFDTLDADIYEYVLDNLNW